MTPPTWLPVLVTLANHSGEWEAYLTAIYGYFVADFVTSRPTYRGERLALKRHPVIAGKEATFWHVISEGKTEQDRLPDLRRCERIRWPRPVIEHEAEAVIKVWPYERNREQRINLWLEDAEYLVVLARRSGYILLWTAFSVTESHRKRKLEQEYQDALKRPGNS